MATINYIELAKKWNSDYGWNTDAGELSSLGEEIGLPFAAKASLNDDQVTQLKNAFEQSKKGVLSTTIPQLQPAPEAKDQGIQSVENTVPVASETQSIPLPDLAPIHQNLINARNADLAQKKQLFENEIEAISAQRFQVGAMKELLGAESEISGGMAVRNAVANSSQTAAMNWLSEQAQMIGAGSGFLNQSSPNPAESSTKVPAPLPSVTASTLEIISKL